MEHTEGEWTIETPCGFPYSGLYVVPVIRKDFPYHIAEIRQLREREESEANAWLIAAAPDLLAVCKALQNYVHNEHCDPHPLGQCELCKIALEVLTKAEKPLIKAVSRP